MGKRNIQTKINVKMLTDTLFVVPWCCLVIVMVEVKSVWKMKDEDVCFGIWRVKWENKMENEKVYIHRTEQWNMVKMKVEGISKDRSG